MQTLFFTVKQWNRFSWSMQEIMCKKYDVILTDYKTRKEKIILLLNKINMKNFNKGMDMFNKSLNKFSKTVDSMIWKSNWLTPKTDRVCIIAPYLIFWNGCYSAKCMDGVFPLVRHFEIFSGSISSKWINCLAKLIQWFLKCIDSFIEIFDIDFI